MAADRARVKTFGKLVLNMSNKMWLSLIALLFVSAIAGYLSLRPISTLERVHQNILQKFEDVAHVSPDQFSQMPSEDLLIFDVREPSEFMVSHIEGARRVPPDMTPEAFMARYHADLSNKTVIFYCSVGHRSSVMAARTQAGIRKQGALGVYNLEAGIFGWHNENRNLVRAGKPTDYVHPYNKVWQRFLKRDSLVRYTPVP